MRAGKLSAFSDRERNVIAGTGKSDCVTGRITSTRPVHNHLLPTPRLTVSYLTIQYQTTFLWMGFCEI